MIRDSSSPFSTFFFPNSTLFTFLQFNYSSIISTPDLISMAALCQLRFCPLSGHYHSSPFPRHPNPSSLSLFINNNNHLPLSFSIGGGGGDGGGIDGGGSRNWGDSDGDSSSSSSGAGFGVLGLFLNGWRSRVAADPQFPFKVLMEELVGVSACVIGDMATRPNFGLNELDFVFSTLVVGCILNFTLMYLLAPTLSLASSSLPGIFANCPNSHMFQPGAYRLLDRFGTLVYKGAVFAGVGFAAGLVGTAISNGLIAVRKKMDPDFETPNKPPPTLLNALTWAAHMGVSSNLRYQTLNGVEFVLEKGLPPLAFKSSVLVLRLLNNVVGGMTFVMLARYTGSQSVGEAKPVVAVEKEKLVTREGDFQNDNNQSASK